MRYISRIILVVVAVAALVLAGGCGAAELTAAPAVPTQRPTQALVEYADGGYLPSMAPERMEWICSQGYVSLFADMTTGHFALEDMRTGTMYYSVPPEGVADELAFGGNKSRLQSELWVEDLSEAEGVMKTRNSWDSCYEKDGLVIERLENGLRIWYKFMEEMFAIPVEYTLCEDGFRATVLCDSIIEQSDRRIYSISVLPYFGAQSGEDGWLLVPDGSGALIRFSSEKQEYATYTQKVYGDRYLQKPDYVPNGQERCALPMVGSQGPEGGFLAISDNGAAYANVKAQVDGQYSSYNTTYFAFDTRVKQDALIGDVNAFTNKTVMLYEQGPVAIGTVSVRYCLLDSTPDTGLSAMAATARAYYAGQTPKAEDGAQGNSLYVSTVGGYRTKTSVMGIRMELTRPLTTVKEATVWLEEQNAAGRDIGLIYEGYLSAELRGKALDGLKPDSAVGSKRDLNALLEAARAGQVYLTVNPQTASAFSLSLNPSRAAIRDMADVTVTTAGYRRDTWFADKNVAQSYLLRVPTAFSLLDSFLKILPSEKVGVCVSSLGDMLYTDYTVNGYTQNQHRQAVNTWLGETAQPWMLPYANDYAAVWAAKLVNVPGYSSGYDLLDEDVPFYQMVFSTGRQLISKPINGYGDVQRELLNCLRNGMTPHYQWVKAEPSELQGIGLESFYGCSDTYWNETLREVYAVCQPLVERTAGQTITDYRYLAENVYQTMWANGVSVIVNMGAESYAGEAGEVAAMSFVVVS